jgi:hypothetical protein
MKPFLKRYAILLPFLFFAAGRALAMPTLEFVPSAQTVNLGDQTTVDINVTGLSGEFVGAFDFDVNWDSSLLSLASVDFGTSLGGPVDSAQSNPLTDSSNPTFGLAGTANVAEVSFADLSTLQTGTDPFSLFSLTFESLAAGTSSLAFSPGLFGGFLGDDLGFSLLTDASATGAITVDPIPAAVYLFLSGLGALTWLGKRHWPDAHRRTA